MTLRDVFAPGLNRNVKLGGYKRAVAPGPSFKLRHYMSGSMPATPASCDYTQNGASLTAALADILGNDAVGDCVIAWLLHQLAIWTGYALGVPFHATRDQALAMYSAITGYVVGNPATDQGTDPQTAINWVIANGFPNGDKPLGSVCIDGTNVAELQQAIYLFEGCGFAVGLPDAYVASMPSGDGFIWDVAGASDSGNGHMFLGAGYDSTGVIVDTWGFLGKFTYKAIAAYAVATTGGEIHILLSADMIAKAALKAPNGIDWASLVQDFDQIGGSVVVPPMPTPSPPTGPATLAAAQAWAAAGIATGFPLMTRAQAIAAANAGLAQNWPAAS